MSFGQLGAGVGSLGLGAAGSPSAGSTDNILVANRNQIATAVASSVASPLTSRRSHYASPQGAISNLKCIDCGFYISAGLIIASPASSYTIKRYIEYPAGVFTQVTWDGGAASKTITLSGASFVSDVVNVTIPAGAKFWERTVHITGSARDIPCQEMPAAGNTIGVDDANSAGDLGNSGTINPSVTTTTFGSTAIVGTIAKANARAFLIGGDSLTWGQGDITSVGAAAGSGWIARGLDPLYPWMKIAKPGISSAQAIALGTPITTLLSNIGASAFTDFACLYGTNDLVGGTAVATITSNLSTLRNSWANGKRLWLATLMPRSTSTDSYATVANQTMKSDGNWSNSPTFNAAIRALPIGATGFFEVADATMSARDSGVWAAPPAPTADGGHPNSTMTATAAGIVAATVG